jgi:glycosyltransferase involved in cell wall biosynthesis
MYAVLGPYAVARLNALSDRYDVIAVEGSRASTIYAWDEVVGLDRFERVTLFMDGAIEAQSRNAVLRRVYAVLDYHKPDVAVVPGWSLSWALAMLAWACERKVPAVVMSESSADDANRVRWREKIKSRIVRNFVAAHVGGCRHVDYLVSLGMPSERIFLGYDAVDNEYFGHGAEVARRNASFWRSRLGLPKNYFLASARFIEKKNLIRLISAYDSYRRRSGKATWHLVLLGDGELRSRIERQISELCLNERVILPGFKQYAELPVYLGLAGAFVHASTAEQWGLVVNEAMACSLPVLVSERCGCTPELVHRGRNGFVFDPLNVEELSARLTEIASVHCDRRAMGQCGRQIISQWGPDRYADGLSQAVGLALHLPVFQRGVFDLALVRAAQYAQ